ncbi:MAG TPA: sigma 54-interacting transcriptional regulator [Gemmatimonadaceae bacterium]
MSFVADSILLGDSAPMRRLRGQIARFAPSLLPVLIHGPTGSGKELVARSLHLQSGRSGAFVAFNVCAVSELMFEDAVFGHVKGAFTGAVAEKAGFLAEANGGTVFFDEIGGLAPASQSKLLRAIETRTFRPVGAGADRISDFRLVAASNEGLDSMVRDGRFRPDLFHRLAGVILDVPPLSARLEDVPALAKNFLSQLRLPMVQSFTASALQVLTEGAWPGNVRELKHTVERAAVLAGSGAIDREHVKESLTTPVADVAFGLSDERKVLLRALMESDWNTLRAARLLGVHRATVYRRMRQLGLTSRRMSQAIRADSHMFAGVDAHSRESSQRQDTDLASAQ